MKITQNCAVTLRLRITQRPDGKLLDDGKQPLAYLHGGYGNLYPKVEAALEGQEKGYQTALDLEPAEAFGEHDPSLLLQIPKTQFPPGVKLGGQLEARGPDGRRRIYTVQKIKGQQVLLDGNHPWVGLPLHLELSVLDVRAATAEEIAHGHVHGAHGHHHG